MDILDDDTVVCDISSRSHRNITELTWPHATVILAVCHECLLIQALLVVQISDFLLLHESIAVQARDRIQASSPCNAHAAARRLHDSIYSPVIALGLSHWHTFICFCISGRV
jgi:hypothetical protein